MASFGVWQPILLVDLNLCKWAVSNYCQYEWESAGDILQKMYAANGQICGTWPATVIYQPASNHEMSCSSPDYV